MLPNKHVMYFQCAEPALSRRCVIEKLGELKIFAPVASDSPQHDLETMAVKNWEGEESVWLMEMKMITSTSTLVEKKKKKIFLRSSEEKK